MSGPVLERAKTGRSTCRSSGEPIDQDSWRVGIEAYRAGRMTTTWLKPRCFLDDMLVEYASTGRSHCKSSGELIQKNECRVAFASGPSKSWYRPSEAAPFVAEVYETCFGAGKKKGGEEGVYDLSEVAGMGDLEDAHRDALLAMFSGIKKVGSKAAPLMKTEEEEEEHAVVGKKRKQSAAKATKKKTKKQPVKEEESESEEEEEEEEEEDDKELVWAKFSSNPWWPGYVAKEENITAAHRAEKPSVPKNTTLVVFFGPRPTWAWVCTGPNNLCKFSEGHHSTKCKTAAFKTALRQADASALKQEQQRDQAAGAGASSSAAAAAAAAASSLSPRRRADLVVASAETPAAPSSSSSSSSSSSGAASSSSSSSSSAMDVESTAAKMDTGLSEYEQARLSNIARNEEFMASLGLSSARAAMRAEVTGGASQRGLGSRSAGRKRTKKMDVTPREPSRRSARNQGLQADGVFIDREDRSGAVTLGGASAAGMPQKLAEEKAERRRLRKEKDSMSLLECADGYESQETDDDGDAADDGEDIEGRRESMRTTSGFVASLQRLSKEAAASGKEPPLAKGEAEYAARLGKLRIGETEVAKVVPDRIYSVAVLPSASSVVAAVGDRSGNLGIWNYSNQDSLEENGVLAFNPHTATINALAFDPTNPAKLFSTSYDGTIRCLDIETSRFDLVYASEVHGRDYWLQHTCLSPDGNTMILGDSDGAISMIDMRTRNASTGASSKGKRGAASNSSSSSGGGGGGFPSGGYGVKWEARCHPKKVQTVSLNPVSPHYLATATLDRAVKIFDLRRLPSGASASGCGGATFDAPDFPEVVSFSENYSVNCAMWNPAGDKVVGVVMGPDGGSKGNLRVYSKPHLMGCSQDGPTPKAKASACQFGAMDGAAASLDHDNKTGRYLPVFHAAWDPKNHDAFVCGSMTQPRIVEVFSTAAINKGGASFAPGKRDKKTMALGCKRVGVLGDGGEYLGSVQSRSAFHPFLDVVVCGNASGRVHIFK